MDAFSTSFGASFKAAAEDAGMTEVATITSGGVTSDCNVHYEGPDMVLMDGAVRSTEHMIELLDPDDCPDIDEGDTVVIGARTYRVRERAFNEERGANGYYRKALLTKV